MSRKIKGEQKKFLGETLNQYDKALNEGIDKLDKKNREQNHKISSLVNSFDNEFLEKDVEGNMTTLENSKDGMVIINEIQGSTEVNYCKDGEKELILNGDIDTQDESFVTITEGVDGGLVDVSLEGNTEINLSKTKDPVLVTREFDDINCNSGKLQYTIDDVTTINDEPGKVDIDRIVGDTIVNHVVNGSEELILNAHINESGDNNITLNGVTSDGGKVDVALEGNTLVNVSNVKDDYITPTIEDKVDQGSVISLPEVSEGLIHIDEIEGNTLVNYCTDGAKELTLNGDINAEGTFVTTTEGADNGLVDVTLEGNTLVNLCQNKGVGNNKLYGTSGTGTIEYIEIENGCKYITNSNTESHITVRMGSHTVIAPNKTYTLVFEIEKNTLNFAYTGITICGIFDSYFGREENRILHDIDFETTVGVKKISFTTPSDISMYDGFGYGFPYIVTTEPGMEFVIKNTMLLEGDWTNKEIPEYFEGMKSVGQDDVNGHKVEVLSYPKKDYITKTMRAYDAQAKPIFEFVDTDINDEGFALSSEFEPYLKYFNDCGTYEFCNNLFDYYRVSEGYWVYLGVWGTDDTAKLKAREVINKYIGECEGNKKEILLNEPLRSLPNGVKDRFVKIGGKWFIERKCEEVVLDGSEMWYNATQWISSLHFWCRIEGKGGDKLLYDRSNEFYGDGYYWIDNIIFKNDVSNFTNVTEFKAWLQQNPVTVVYELATPVYEPLEIEPTLNTYNDTTHLSNNSIIPCNMQIKNTGYNAIIKPNTLYTVAVDTNKNGEIRINLGGAEVTTTNNVATITTPATLSDDGLRLYGKSIKGSRVRLLEGDKTNCIPSFFEGMKSSFEDKVQEDGSYKMEVLMSNKNLVRLTSENAYGLRVGSSYIIHSENSLTLKGTTSYSSIKFKQKLKPLTEYHISCDATLKKGSGATIRVREERLGVPDTYTVLYNSESIAVNDKIHINGTFTTKDVTDMAIYPNSSWDIEEESELLIENLQISEVEGDYVESKSSIIQLSSIAPLRGVGDVHDRLVSKDGKLMIERRCKGVTLDGSDDEGWFVHEGYNTKNTLCLSSTHTIFPEIRFINMYSNYEILCDKFNATCYFNIFSAKTDEESIGFNGDNLRSIFIKINKSKLQTQDATGFKQWLQQNPVTLVYVLKEPTYEEIPYDLQKIILESYDNGTLFIDTNIPPTKVSFNCFEEELTYLYPSTSYTVQFISDKAIAVDITLGGTQLLAQNIVKGLNRITITTPSTLVDNKLIINGVGAKISNIVVTDTDRKFMYFEGMKSVGECEELEVKSGNKNLFDCELEVGAWNNYGGKEDNATTIRCSDLIEIKPNTSYIFSGSFIINNYAWIKVFSEDKTQMVQSYNLNNVIDTPSWAKYMVFHCVKENIDINGTVQLEEGSTATDYIPHQSNAQQLTHEPLRRAENVKDKYTLIDGKWYIERRCGEIVLDGSQNWDDYLGNNLMQCHLPNSRTTYNIKCDNIIPKSYQELDNVNNYGIAVIVDAVRARIPNITTPSEIDEYFTNNPTRIVYLLATPQYEPINYNPLEVYSDTTHISTNSVIPCNIIVKNHGYNLVALKENTQYTLYVNKNTTNALTYRLGDYVEINSLSKFTFTTPSTLTDKTLRIDGKGAKVNDLMLIEGTPTNDSIGYFDGLKSSYECEQVTDENDVNYGKYKVDVKVVGKNLFNAKAITNYSYQINNGITPSCSSNGEVILNGIAENIYDFRVLSGNNIGGNISNNRPLYKYVHSLPNGTSLTISNDLGFEGYWVLFRNGKTTYHKDTINIQTGDIVNCFIRIPLGTTLNNQVIHIQVEQGDTATEYEPYFESKQTVYLNSPLLKGDEIVWKDNKIQHYHKMHKVVLDGSDDEGWKRDNLTNNYTDGSFIATLLTVDMKDKTQITTGGIVDKLPNASMNREIYSSTILQKSCYSSGWRQHFVCLKNTSTLEEVLTYLQQNPLTVVYELETPYYEEISDYPLKLNVIANSSLSTESTIQVTNISFNIYEETLPYLYPNTKYYITFNADVDRNNIIINLGGSHVVFDCKVGFNKVEITTPSDTTNLLTFSGTGVNIDHVKVTQQDIDEYFEGMKSVGECEELEVTSANSDNTLSNTQQLTHEPLRAVGNVKDKYILINGKWYIERNICNLVINKDNLNVYQKWASGSDDINTVGFLLDKSIFNEAITTPTFSNICINSDIIKPVSYGYAYDNDEECISTPGGLYSFALKINKSKLIEESIDGLKEWLKDNPITVNYIKATPVYEPINYNPFEVYSDTTHITANSLIPTNVVVKNHGYNCILKPSTKYTIVLNKPNGTISAKLGGSAKVDSTNSIFTITTPSTLNDNVLRLSGSGKVKDIMILEGDKTVNTPSYFEGIESVFEQEYDTEKGKYRVTARVEGNGKESSITFYLNEPLRIRDKAFIKDGKVVVERNYGEVTLDGSENWIYMNHNASGLYIRFRVDNFINTKTSTSTNNLSNMFNCYDDTVLYNQNLNLEGFATHLSAKRLWIQINKAKLQTQDVVGFKQWLQQNPVTVVYELAEPTYEEVDCDLSKLVLENYKNSSLIFESNIPVSANIRYSGEVPVVTQAKALSSQVDNTTLDINENIIPYMCDIDYRIVELQLMNGDTQGEGIELLGIGDIEILGNENVLFNNREDKKYNYSYDMLKRDILSQRYSKEEYQYRLDRYLLANKISNEEYKELEGLLNNGK